MNYQETLDWMFAQLPMFQRQGARAYKANLDNIHRLSHHLGSPEKQFKSIHVAGTNGKGSTSHMLASIFQQAGYKTGLYTSPHLKDFRERIKINGGMVPETWVINFVAKNRPFIEKNQLSFFEMTVGMAFTYFAENKVDIAIIEVGLGGRLDATNIINPELSIITNIALDHTEFLGSDLRGIASEKAGIIKNKIPVIIGETQDEIINVFKSKAEENGSSILFADQFIVELGLPETDLLGTYQLKNQKTVLAAIRLLQKEWPRLNDKAIKRGFSSVVKNTGLMGRWQVLSKTPLTICDTAHNQSGLIQVMEQLQKLSYDKLHIVIGMVVGKNPEDTLKLFPKKATYYFCQPDLPRALPVDELYKIAQKIGLMGEKHPQPLEALKMAQSRTNENDMILITGSNFVVAEILP